MKLVASMMVRNEISRYLEACVGHLLPFCDEVRIRDDFSEDGSFLWALEQGHPVQPARIGSTASFFSHEGRARQELLDWTLAAHPTHVLSIDADEFVTDGQALRAACEADEGNGAWTLPIEEVWRADERALHVRQDGGWRPHPVPVLWRVPARLDGSWRIQDRALACGREPLAVRALARQATATGVSLLHFGWACEADRADRYERYVQADGGRFHNRRHLDSIMWADRRVRTRPREWPAALEPWRPAILGRANQLALA